MVARIDSQLSVNTYTGDPTTIVLDRVLTSPAPETIEAGMQNALKTGD